jgi:GAF domain-containing protein
VPIALVSLVDLNRQWFKSCIGIDVRETSRDESFCTYAILQDEPLVVEDATRDPRFANNPYVVGEPGIRAYAGMPLRGPTGYKLGTLCLIDRQTRRFSESDINDLKDLASIVENELGAVELNEALAAQRQTAEENARLYQSAQRELSQRRKAEAERAEALESLQKAVLELERLSAAKSTFVSTVSHEFRTGLTSVLGFSDLLRTEELTGDEVRSFGELIGDTSRRLNRMINELLDLDRIESGLVKLQREPVSVNDLVRRCVSLLEMTMADHSFRQELDPSDPCVLADDDRLVQV